MFFPMAVARESGARFGIPLAEETLTNPSPAARAASRYGWAEAASVAGGAAQSAAKAAGVNPSSKTNTPNFMSDPYSSTLRPSSPLVYDSSDSCDQPDSLPGRRKTRACPVFISEARYPEGGRERDGEEPQIKDAGAADPNLLSTVPSGSLVT